MKHYHITNQWLENNRWGLRTDTDGVSQGGFRWSPLGEWTEEPRFDEQPSCRNGLFAITPAAHGDGLMPRGRVVLVEIDRPAGLVQVWHYKTKFRRARIVAIGRDIPVQAFHACGIQCPPAGVHEMNPGINERVVVLEGRTEITGLCGGHVSIHDGADVVVNGMWGGLLRASGRCRVELRDMIDGTIHVWGDQADVRFVGQVRGLGLKMIAGGKQKLTPDGKWVDIPRVA